MVTGIASSLVESSRFIKRLQQGQLIRPQSHWEMVKVKSYLYFTSMTIEATLSEISDFSTYMACIEILNVLDGQRNAYC